jgi:hypothetical protein
MGWVKLESRFLEWSAGPAGSQDVDAAKERFLLLSCEKPTEPDKDFYEAEEVKNSVREVEEVLRPMAVSAGPDGLPRKWTAQVEKELRERGIKLCDSKVLQAKPSPILFGARIFHLAYRYFLVAILSGEFPSNSNDFELDNKRFLRYYFVCMSAEEANIERCV